MIKSKVCLLAVAVLVASGCAKRIKTRHEPMDPNDGAAQKGSDAELDALLKEAVLHFGFDDTTLTTADQSKLRKVANALHVRPWVAVRIAGHADERGTEEYNLALGQRRADAARAYLAALGVSEEQLDTVTFGEEAPLVNESNESAWAQNRRDELGVMPLDLFSYVEHEVVR